MEALSGSQSGTEVVAPPAGKAADISLLDIVSALSFALDLTEDSLPGHSVRTCQLGMRIGEAVGLGAAELSGLYYALVLKDVGCSSNAARLEEIRFNDRGKAGARAGLKEHLGSYLGSVRRVCRGMPFGRVEQNLQTGLEISQGPEKRESLIGVRAERGARIASKVGLPKVVAESIRHLDERWDGSGHPDGLRGDRIPMLSRILSVAQSLDVFHTEQGAAAAMTILKERSGRWFDPRIVKAAQALSGEQRLWGMPGGWAADQVRARYCGGNEARNLDEAELDIDSICEAFADVVDARSSFTFTHSMGVTRAASMIAEQLGLAPERQRLVYRAALLHDIGKLRVPNAILDKPGKLDAAEWAVIREHPALTQRILEGITAFAEIAQTASQHHERLDGSGYPHGLTAKNISIESRVIAVADVYSALSEERPYRGTLPKDEIVAIMSKDVPEKLDRDCFEALLASLKRKGGTVRMADGRVLASKRPGSASSGTGMPIRQAS